MHSSASLVARAVKTRRVLAQAGAAVARTVFQGDGWRVADIVCSADADDPPFEERHAYVSIALVTAGAFTYRNDAGRACLCSGSILLGGADGCFTCGHEHGAGDRCIAFQFSQRRYEELLSSLAAPPAGLRFPRAALPASKETAALAMAAEALAAGRTPDDAHELAVRLVSWVMAALDQRAPERAPTATQARAMAAIARVIEADVSADHALDVLAVRAEMSPFHFIRCFKRVIGMTPHAFVRAARLRDAARLLRESQDSIAVIAFEVGFQDLSVFNDAFRQVFGATPRRMRARMIGPAPI